MYGKNVIAIRTCELFKRFNFILNYRKNGDFDISDKEHFGCPVTVEEDELLERWKR